jgi:hypothetical protein
MLLDLLVKAHRKFIARPKVPQVILIDTQEVVGGVEAFFLDNVLAASYAP